MQKAEQTLLRKQFLVTKNNVIKIEKIAKFQGTSATNIVRQAIDAYNPDGLDSIGENELMQLVSERLKEAIKDTRKTRKHLSKALRKLEKN